MFAHFKQLFVSYNKHISVDLALVCLMALVFQRTIQPNSKLSLMDWLASLIISHFLKSLSRPQICKQFNARLKFCMTIINMWKATSSIGAKPFPAGYAEFLL